MTASSSARSLAPSGTRSNTPRRHSRILSLTAVAAVGVMVLAACGTKPSEKAAAAAPTKPLVVGISLPLTGDFSQPGGEAKRGYEVWQTMVNAKGGVLGRKVELKITDDASNQDTVVADYTKLITQDKVDLILGTFSSLLNYSPKMMFQTSAPSNASQYSDAVGMANTEGVFYTVSWNEKAKTPLNPEFVAAYAKAYAGAIPAEDAADAFAAAQILQAATTAVGSVDQTKIRDWLHANTPETILGPLSWDATGAPKGQFLLAQWQSGTVEVVGPADAATTKTVVNPKPAWK